ncbi:hypothetical protein L211DRAFT_842744 [Terfezia boudieri ATCC MYA-4762]|uniref:Uncharacterized protein n=1 Tax=Terfezia boudieri ATCC MYA-4762 TaxID=1051890 RepID=A0A3N4LCY2_9PEZI|nr:hypothetical protein L211DRAFT_842744 [Terfezia boudieri ATCC MYA-4762]
MPEAEEEILECIRVGHPGLWLSLSALQHQFISPPTEVVEYHRYKNAVLATYLPGEAYEPEIEAPLPPPLVNPMQLYHLLKACCSSRFKVTPLPTPLPSKMHSSERKKGSRFLRWNTGGSMSSAE